MRSQTHIANSVTSMLLPVVPWILSWLHVHVTWWCMLLHCEMSWFLRLYLLEGTIQKEWGLGEELVRVDRVRFWRLQGLYMFYTGGLMGRAASPPFLGDGCHASASGRQHMHAFRTRPVKRGGQSKVGPVPFWMRFPPMSVVDPPPDHRPAWAFHPW